MKLAPMRGTLKKFTEPKKAGNYEIAYIILMKKTTNEDDEVVEKNYAIKVFCNENNKRFITSLIGKKVEVTTTFSSNSWNDKDGNEQWNQTVSMSFIKEYVPEGKKEGENEGQDQEDIDEELRRKAKEKHDQMQQSLNDGVDDLPF